MSDQQTRHKADVRKEGDRELRIERVFDAPRDVVFKAFTDPELIAQWWGPRGTETVVDEVDFRTGGDWRFVSRDSDGGETAFRGTFREVVAPERIAWTFEWDGMPGYPMVQTLTLEDLGDGRTRVVSLTMAFTREERDGMLGSGMEGGMNESYAALDKLLAKLG